MSLGPIRTDEDGHYLTQAYASARNIGFVISERRDGKFAFFKPGRPGDAFIAQSPRQLAKWLDELSQGANRVTPNQKPATTQGSFAFLLYQLKVWGRASGFKILFNSTTQTSASDRFKLQRLRPVNDDRPIAGNSIATLAAEHFLRGPALDLALVNQAAAIRVRPVSHRAMAGSHTSHAPSTAALRNLTKRQAHLGV